MGLRTGNIYSPWPEELNRKVTTSIADLHFAPTQQSADNLLKENVAKEKIIVTGNTVIDALLEVVEKIKNDEGLQKTLANKFPYLKKDKKLILVTGHRRENFGDGFENICNAIKKLASREDVEIIYPVHLNPNVQDPVNRILKGLPNVFLIEPLDYLSFVYLMERCYLIISDSGGVQEEAPSLGKPVLVTRDTTERPEAVDAGTVRLVGTNANHIYKHANELLDNQDVYKKMSVAHNPYGDGMAVGRIINKLGN